MAEAAETRAGTAAMAETATMAPRESAGTAGAPATGRSNAANVDRVSLI